jgi:[ribosomal protein S5]-alanine N-acetyltransferase
MQLLPIYPTAEQNPRFAMDPACRETFQLTLDYYQIIGFQSPWICYYAEKDGNLVGSCAFKGGPVDGRVEIAYATFEAYQQQGVASEMCRILTAMAKETDPDIVVTARTLPEPNYSTVYCNATDLSMSGLWKTPMMARYGNGNIGELRNWRIEELENRILNSSVTQFSNSSILQFLNSPILQFFKNNQS